MSRSIRKLVGGGAAALAIGGFFALIVAPALAGAISDSHPSTAKTSTGLASILAETGSVLKTAADKKLVKAVRPALTPSGTCATAQSNLASAKAQDKAEDTTERANASADANFKASDVAEDKAESAARKPLLDAVRAACGTTKAAPSPQCAAALQSLKAAFQAEQGEDTSEKSAGTEGTAGDATEDQSERSRMLPLFQAIGSSCQWNGHDGHFARTGSTRSYSFQH
jgi:type IV secretory pathway VirB10-like protein